MKQGFFLLDERTDLLNGRISFYLLMLTQIALVLMIAYKRYILKQDPSYYGSFTFIVVASMLIYWAARLYLSGILPVISWKWLLLIYIGLVALISIPSALIHGLPTKENWTNTILPAALGPAVIIVAYWLIAYFGKLRVENLLK